MKKKRKVLELIIQDINEAYKQDIQIVERSNDLLITVENKAVFKDVFVLLTSLDNVCFLNFYLHSTNTFVIF